MTYECGYPKKRHPLSDICCPCGWIFPHRVVIDFPDAHSVRKRVRRETLDDPGPLFRERPLTSRKLIKRERL
jgi:hypothetical protein